MITQKINREDLKTFAKQVIDIELNALSALKSRVDDSFVAACELILSCKGKVVVTGMGKSGHIGNKIAATLASTGTPSFFMHPGEANHGDLGMLAPDDILLAISNSGETSEVINLLPVVKRIGVPIISMTNNHKSTLAQYSNVMLDVSVEKEACSLGLAPTASTTVTLVLGDALAVSLLDARGFTPNDFALSHPGGTLGRKLLLRVEDIMLQGQDIPIVISGVKITDALIEISKKGLGFTCIVNENNELLGIFTDGDLRRVLDQKIDLHNTLIVDVMTPNGIAVRCDIMAVDALNLMENKRISALTVVDSNNHPIGAFNMHILLKAGVV